jgi:hypothetical protein
MKRVRVEIWLHHLNVVVQRQLLLDLYPRPHGINRRPDWQVASSTLQVTFYSMQLAACRHALSIPSLVAPGGLRAIKYLRPPCPTQIINTRDFSDEDVCPTLRCCCHPGISSPVWLCSDQYPDYTKGSELCWNNNFERIPSSG